MFRHKFCHLVWYVVSCVGTCACVLYQSGSASLGVILVCNCEWWEILKNIYAKMSHLYEIRILKNCSKCLSILRVRFSLPSSFTCHPSHVKKTFSRKYPQYIFIYLTQSKDNSCGASCTKNRVQNTQILFGCLKING